MASVYVRVINKNSRASRAFGQDGEYWFSYDRFTDTCSPTLHLSFLPASAEAKRVRVKYWVSKFAHGEKKLGALGFVTFSGNKMSSQEFKVNLTLPCFLHCEVRPSTQQSLSETLPPTLPSLSILELNQLMGPTHRPPPLNYVPQSPDQSNYALESMNYSPTSPSYAPNSLSFQPATDTSTVTNESNVDTSKLVQTDTEKEDTSAQLEFIEDFRRCFIDDDIGKDVTFNIGTKTIKAHKFMLSARSVVFKKMFETDMKESRTETVDIIDISFEAFSAFLEFIYTNECNNLSELAEELIYAADKYEVRTLKNHVAKEMMSKMNVNNVVNLLILFDRYQLAEYKRDVLRYIVRHKIMVFTVTDKKEFEREHPVLAQTIDLVSHLLDFY